MTGNCILYFFSFFFMELMPTTSSNILKHLFAVIFLIHLTLPSAGANFEDTRCRCTCPSTEYFSSKNKTVEENYRRYYTKTNLNSANCNTRSVVKPVIVGEVDASRLDAFLANCNCRFESRNSLLLKVVVLFVLCVLIVLGSYMAYLVVIEPMLRQQQPFIPYRRHGDDDVGLHTFWFHQDSDASDTNTLVASDTDEPPMEENIFAQASMSGGEESSSEAHPSSSELHLNAASSRAGDRGHLHEKVINHMVAEQHKWKSDVEEQRRNVLNHSVLN